MTSQEYKRLVLIKHLYSAGWSLRDIAYCIKGTTKNNVKAMYYKALDELHEDNEDNFPKSRKSIDLRYVGDTSDVEYLEGDINHNVCGGGRKVNQVNYE